jgi:hypothetical protein
MGAETDDRERFRERLECDANTAVEVEAWRRALRSGTLLLRGLAAKESLRRPVLLRRCKVVFVGGSQSSVRESVFRSIPTASSVE